MFEVGSLITLNDEKCQTMLSSVCTSLPLNFTKPLGMLFYHENVNQHFKNPQNTGSLDMKDDHVGTGIVGAPACGDALKLQVKINDKGVIEDVKFRAFGCPAAVASSSLATTMIKGKTVEEALAIKNTAIAKELNLPPVKQHCSMLAQDAIRASITNWRKKQELKKKKQAQ